MITIVYQAKALGVDAAHSI